MSVLILHPREIQILWYRLRQRKLKQRQLIKVRQVLAYLVREHNKTSQTRKVRKIRTKKKKKPSGVLKNVMQEYQKGCKKNNILYVLKRNR